MKKIKKITAYAYLPRTNRFFARELKYQFWSFDYDIMTFYGCTQVTYRSLLLSINRKRLNCYSMLFLIISRIKLLFSAPFIRALDNKFGDQADDLWLHHTSKPLEDTISKYSKDSDDNKLPIGIKDNHDF
jgi:hypothetical protein